MIEPYYEEPDIKLYCGDCLKILPQIPDKSVDLVLTSPPYDNLRIYHGYTFDFKSIAKELYRVTKDGGVAVWVVGDATIKGSETGTSFKQALYFKEIGFNLHDTMIYQKRSIPLNHNRYEQHFEFMFVFSKGVPKIFNPILQENKPRKGSKNEGFHNQPDGTKKKISAKRKTHSIIGNIWKYNVGFMNSTKDKTAFKCPATFPEQLANDHIKSWSNELDLILDPFLGSGTTLIACKELNRKGIGIEISREYCDVAVQRLRNTTPNLL